MKLHFLGAAGTVTGSKHALFHTDSRVVLVDCGLFQGLKELRLRNWTPLPIDASRITDVIVTHAHIDHTGYLPRLVKTGFSGRIWATPATAELMRILLPDTAHLQEEEALYANRKGYSKHRPALPLFTIGDAARVFPLIRTVEYEEHRDLGNGLGFSFRDAGHILGSALCKLRWNGRSIVFSGDIGQPNSPILEAPSHFDDADFVVFETTYGDRVRDSISLKDDLADAVGAGIKRGGAIVIPAFAVERTQELLFLLGQLQNEKRIPTVPIYVDSPMAIEVLKIFINHQELYGERAREIIEEKNFLTLPNLHIASTPEQSKAINRAPTPLIIVSSSGMATGGRVVHHLSQRLPRADCTVLLVGYQAVGTRGRQLQEGQASIKMLGQRVPVKAAVRTVHGFSGHADANDLMAWLRNFRRAPERAFAVHGEPTAARAFVERVRAELGWTVEVAEYLEWAELG